MNEQDKQIACIGARLIIHELMPRLKRANIEIQNSPISPEKVLLAATAKWCGAWDTHHIRQKFDEAFK